MSVDQVRLDGASRSFGSGHTLVVALHPTDLVAGEGELVAVMGPSGSGKTTLLSLVGGLDRPTGGRVIVADLDLAQLDARGLAVLRRRTVGYVFQELNLLSGLTARENVSLPLELDGATARDARAAADEALASVDMADLAQRFPDDLSGGEQQRVAIARAMVGGRRILLADEPTGALDTRGSQRRSDESRVRPGRHGTRGREAALVASAAFAVSVRRRQRELGLLGAVGAEPGHLRASVLAEGMLLGGLGAVIGMMIGVAAAAMASPWLDELTDRRNPPLVLQPHWLLIAVAIGLGAALVAAAIPARTAARVPVMEALSGRRPAVAPAGRTMRLGLASVGLGFAVTLAGALYRLQDAVGPVWISLLLAGAVLGVLGFGACSPWLLERLERLASGLPLSPRLALRDTARFRSRNGPIVTAVLAGFAATVAVAALLASQDVRAAQNYQPMLRGDQLTVVGAGATAAGPQIARELGALAAAPLTTTDLVDEDEGTLVSYSIRVGNVTPVGTDTPAETDTPDEPHYLGGPAVGDEDVLIALGGESAVEEFRQGYLVLFSDREVSGPAVMLRYRETPDGGAVDESIGEVPYRALQTEVPYGSVPTAVISRESGARLGIVAEPDGRYLIRLAHPVTDQEVARAGEVAQAHPRTAVNVERGPQRPGEAFRMVLLLASLAFALSVTGIAVALGEAEARSDQRMLLALGADPSVRRRITAARAGVLAAIAGVLAVPAGLLPVWGLLFTADAPIVVPVPEVLGALAILPITAVVGAALLSRPIGPWTAYRA